MHDNQATFPFRLIKILITPFFFQIKYILQNIPKNILQIFRIFFGWNNIVLFRPIENIFRKYKIFKNSLVVKMRILKLINYSTNMCQNYQVPMICVFF